MAAGLDDGLVRGVGKLGAEHLADRVTHLKHSANPCAGRNWQRHGLERVAAANNELPVAFGESAFFNLSDRRNLIRTCA
jgi:hypothetical protein